MLDNLEFRAMSYKTEGSLMYLLLYISVFWSCDMETCLFLADFIEFAANHRHHDNSTSLPAVT